MNDPPDDAVFLHLTQLLDQHLYRPDGLRRPLKIRSRKPVLIDQNQMRKVV